ncbi:hypothetical protein Syun_029601 [Stephania yunnanensis]|uniref:Uncharacterized protein n=1 Tax=Stephania yunnanensis TaxID=152371 RepID=A0AAP0HJN1_9MAGN
MTKVVTQPLVTTLSWSIHASKDVAHVSLRDRDCSVVPGCAQALRVLAGARQVPPTRGGRTMGPRVLPWHGARGMLEVCLARAKARPCSCQGMTLLVLKESVKVSPCSCQGTCQGAALLVPRRGLARAQGICLARAQGTCQGLPVHVPRNLPRATELLILPSFPWIANEFWGATTNKLHKREIMLCVDNMTKWMNVKRELPPRHHMVEMLSKVHGSMAPVPPLLNRFVKSGERLVNTSTYKVTCLSMVVLAKVVAPFFLSSSVLAKSMTDALHEAFEVFYYVDENVNSQSIDMRKRILAKLLLGRWGD